METRRIRRIQRRRRNLTVVLAMSLAVIGVAVGLALPRDMTVSFVLLAAVAGVLVIVALRDDAIAPLHGLHRVVRMPLATSIAATFESFRSRFVGSVRALGRVRPHPTPLDEPSEDADAWWGATTGPASPPPTPPSTAQAPELPAPVLAAPLPTARVAANPSPGLRVRVEQLGAAMRRRLEAVAKRGKRSAEEAGAPT